MHHHPSRPVPPEYWTVQKVVRKQWHDGALHPPHMTIERTAKASTDQLVEALIVVLPP